VEGIFITFEGPDGAGKTTQLQRLAKELQAMGYEIVVTREPGGTVISDQIRSIILSPDNQEMVDQAEVLLYAASRAQHVHQRILPALQNKKIVLCDRFIDASIAYQAYGLGIDIELVDSISRFASSGLQASRTYLLDIPVEISQKRLLQRSNGSLHAQLDRIEQKGLEYHRRVREGFHRIAENQPKRIVVINAHRTEDEIAGDIWTDCKRLLEEHFAG
jgi:dTMP kinase